MVTVPDENSKLIAKLLKILRQKFSRLHFYIMYIVCVQLFLGLGM